MNSETVEIAAPLLENLRSALDNPTTEYAVPPVRLTGGLENDIFAFQLRAAPQPFDRPLVVRIFRSKEAQPLRAKREAAVHESLAKQGFAVPRVFFTGDGSDGIERPCIIMEQAPGCPMLADAVRRPWKLLTRMPRLLASTAAELHRLDVEVVLAALEAAGIERQWVILDLWEQPASERIARPGLSSLEELGGWLDHHRPASRENVLNHGDFHPMNLLVDRGRVSAVLDWGLMMCAPREHDLAASRILLSYSPSGFHGIVGRFLDLLRRAFLRRYETLYRAEHPVDEELIRYFEVLRAFQILLTVAEWRIEGTATDVPAVEYFHLSRLMTRVLQVSDIRVGLPPAIRS